MRFRSWSSSFTCEDQNLGSDECFCCFQGFDRRVWNPEVPAARYAGGPAACPSPHPHQEVPGQRRHRHVVPHLHVGHHLPSVSNTDIRSLLTDQSLGLSFFLLLQERGSSDLVRHGHPALWDPEDLDVNFWFIFITSGPVPSNIFSKQIKVV